MSMLTSELEAFWNLYFPTPGVRFARCKISVTKFSSTNFSALCGAGVYLVQSTEFRATRANVSLPTPNLRALNFQAFFTNIKSDRFVLY